MKQLIIGCSALFLFACAGQPKSASQEAAQQQTPAAHQKPAEQLAAVNGKLPDPVCEMPYDTSYKEWTVYKSDTIHFCSPTCKGVFEKNPEKFMAKLGK